MPEVFINYLQVKEELFHCFHGCLCHAYSNSKELIKAQLNYNL